MSLSSDKIAGAFPSSPKTKGAKTKKSKPEVIRGMGPHCLSCDKELAPSALVYALVDKSSGKPAGFCCKTKKCFNGFPAHCRIYQSWDSEPKGEKKSDKQKVCPCCNGRYLSEWIGDITPEGKRFLSAKPYKGVGKQRLMFCDNCESSFFIHDCSDR